MKVWKALGLAGLAGVAATGAVIARNERRRAQMTSEEVRARLHRRLDDVQPEPENPAPPEAHDAAERSGCLMPWRRRGVDRARQSR